jgi:hypothetical protein
MAVDMHRVNAVADGLEKSSTAAGSLVGSLATSRSVPAQEPRLRGYLAWAAVFLAIVVFNEQAIDQLRAGYGGMEGSENGPLENAQLVVMVPAVLLFGLAWVRGLGAVRVAGYALAMIGALAFAREVDFKSLTGGSQAGFDWLVAHGLQDGLLALLGVALVLYLFVQRRYFWSVLRLGLRWQAWPCVASFTLFAAAELYFDGLSGPNAHFWEELVETNGYFLLAVAAWRHASLIGDPDLDRPV